MKNNDLVTTPSTNISSELASAAVQNHLSRVAKGPAGNGHTSEVNQDAVFNKISLDRFLRCMLASGAVNDPSQCVNEESGAIELVKPCICSPLQYSSAWAFHVVVTVATPDACACIVIRCAFFLDTVRTTWKMEWKCKGQHTLCTSSCMYRSVVCPRKDEHYIRILCNSP